MTTTPVIRRPDRIKFAGSALPQMGLAAHAAATLQMLHPMMMHMIDQA